MLRTAELALLKNQCELERSSILNILMLSLESPRVAGYNLTQNPFMFLETNGNVAWLYLCPKVFLPLQLMDQGYNRIPIMYKEIFDLSIQLRDKSFNWQIYKTVPTNF